MTVTFNAIPRSITSGGSVRFFPVTTSTKPVTGYDWDYGDGTSHGTAACPVHAYPTVATYTTYDVTLVLTYADGTTESSTTIAKYISSDAIANIPASTHLNSVISVFLYSATKMMMVNRVAWAGSSYYLINPKITNSIDIIGTATFTLVDIGNSTADEEGLIVEGTNVVIIMGQSIAFSGVIRRCTQDVTNAYSSATKFYKWEIECDSDLAKLQKLNVSTTVFTSTGAPINDTIGNIARMVLTGTPDVRGVIDCTGNPILYQLNSANQSESVGSQYDHLMALAAQNNYDLRSRPSYLVFPYSSFDGSTVLTVGGGGDTPVFTVNEFANMYVFFVGRSTPVQQTFTTNYAVNNDRLLITTANTIYSVGDRVKLSSTTTLPAGLSTLYDYYVKTVTTTYVVLSRTPGGAAVTFSDNGTGTHHIIAYIDISGVPFYGKIASNTATTITLTSPVGTAPPSTSAGYFILYRGYYAIDFAPDISQPSVVKNLNVNNTCFEYNDNDDKKKLSTKIVVSGKDLQGKTIYVSVSGVHAYNTTNQFFNDSTYVTKKSEGYVYKNSFVGSLANCTAIIPRSSIAITKTDLGSNTTELYLPTSQAGFVVLQEVTFTAPPRPLVAGTPYFINSHNSDAITVSATQGGSTITLLENLLTYDTDWNIYNTASAAGVITVTIKGTVAKYVSISNGLPDHVSCTLVAEAMNGYVDNQGCTWQAISDGSYNIIRFITTDTSYSGTIIAMNMGTTGQTASEDHHDHPAITCNASTPAQIQADNSKGLLQKGTSVVFRAATMPTGLTAGTIYTVGNDGVNLSAFCFTVYSGGTRVNFTTTGTTVKYYRVVDVTNRNSSGTSSIWLYGTGYVIDTSLTYSLLTPYGTYENITFSDTGTSFIASDGTTLTQFAIVESTLPGSDYGGRGFLMAPRLYVDNHSRIGGNYEVLIGEEKITVTARGNDSTRGNYIDIGTAAARITSATIKCYPHGVGALVARTNYTEASSETGSSVALYGLRINQVTVDNNITYGILDAYATTLLLGLGNFWKKASTWSPLDYAYVLQTGQYYKAKQCSGSSLITVGDNITITEVAGGATESYEVVETTIIANEGRMMLVLGDYEKNNFTSLIISTNGINKTIT
jgi:hypothetical protein